MTLPRAVFLDVGWTLTHPRESLWAALGAVVAQNGGTSTADDLEQTVYSLMQHRLKQSIARFKPGTEHEDSDEAFRAVFHSIGSFAFQLAGIEDNHEMLTNQMLQRFWALENWVVFPDVIPAIRQLRAQGIGVSVISNAGSELVGFLELIGLAPYMDHILVSAVEGMAKPDQRLFRHALDRTGVSASEAIHVGDMYLEDILGARQLGIRPFLIDRGSFGMFPNHPILTDQASQKNVDLVHTLDEVLTTIYPEA